MNEDQQNFDELKQLLKLKRHELPPPGYFAGFSDQVISRIRAGEAGQNRALADKLEVEVPWLLNFLRLFDARPGMVGGLAASLCLLLLVGVIFAEYSDQAPRRIVQMDGASAQPGAPALASLVAPMPASTVADSGGIVASTNPVTSLQPVVTMFGQPAQNPLFAPAMPAGFTSSR
jgi:hypothetical protein